MARAENRAVKIFLDEELFELVSEYRQQIGHASMQLAAQDLLWQASTKLPMTGAQIAAIRRAFHEARLWAFDKLADAHKQIRAEMLASRAAMIANAPPDQSGTTRSA